MVTKNTSDINLSEQNILNKSKDDAFDVLVVEPVEYVPANGATAATVSRKTSDQLEFKVDEVDSSTKYVGFAAPGTATSEAKWQIQKISVSGTVKSGVYADRNTNFDNVWDNRTSLTYS